MKKCKTCVHKAVCEKSKHIENYRSAGCEHYKDEAVFVEVKHGEWVILSETEVSRIVMCTSCKAEFYCPKKGALQIHLTSYCNKCGAKC